MIAQVKVDPVDEESEKENESEKEREREREVNKLDETEMIFKYITAIDTHKGKWNPRSHKQSKLEKQKEDQKAASFVSSAGLESPDTGINSAQPASTCVAIPHNQPSPKTAHDTNTFRTANRSGYRAGGGETTCSPMWIIVIATYATCVIPMDQQQ